MNKTNICLHRIAACILAFFLAVNGTLAATSPAIGVVTQCQNARIGATFLSAGSSVFDGDVLSTEEQGALQVRVGSARLQLAEQSAAKLQGTANMLRAELLRGSLVLSSANASAFTVAARGAELSPAEAAPVIARIEIAGPRALKIFATRGALRFSYGGETSLVPEGSQFGIILDPTEAEAAAAQKAAGAQTPSKDSGKQDPNNKSDQEPKPPTPNRRYLIVIIAGAAGVGLGYGIFEATRPSGQLESPDRP